MSNVLLTAKLTLVAGSALLCACATTGETQRREAATGTVMHRPARAIDPAGVNVPPLVFGDADFAYVDGNTGLQLTFDEVVARARAAQVVVVGEQHDQPLHHEVQRRLVAVLSADGPELSVGLEMLNWDAQGELDRFNRGEVAPGELELTVNWAKAWGFPFSLYQPIFEDGRRGGAQFFGFNPPRELVRKVRKQGIDSLSAQERERLPELDLSDELHRSWFQQVFANNGHPLSQADLNGFYLAQVLWDEAMAAGAIKRLDAGARQVVVLCGVGHIAQGRGVPQRVERRRAGVRTLSVVTLSSLTEENVRARITEAVINGDGDIIAIPKLDEVIVL
jgi:uncharacterized iron-regulated protein